MPAAASSFGITRNSTPAPVGRSASSPSGTARTVDSRGALRHADAAPSSGLPAGESQSGLSTAQRISTANANHQPLKRLASAPVEADTRASSPLENRLGAHAAGQRSQLAIARPASRTGAKGKSGRRSKAMKTRPCASENCSSPHSSKQSMRQ
jgi:hypothetical protein